MYKVLWHYPGSKNWVEGISRYYTWEDADYQVTVWRCVYRRNEFKIVEV